jgi:plasmid stabilization system protein ParE
MRLVVAPRFRSDINAILNYLEEVAGPRLAARYSGRFAETIVRLTRFPESGSPRAALGAHTRIAIV